MKAQNELIFIAQLLGELLNSLNDGPTKTALVGHSSMCLAIIEQNLREAAPMPQDIPEGAVLAEHLVHVDDDGNVTVEPTK